MTRTRIGLPFLVLALFLTLGLSAQDEKRWDIMTQHEMGVDRFARKYPDFDGKGVVIAVLDTGVDMGVPGLTSLPGGGAKVVDVRDFSTEGDLFWTEGDIVPDGSGEKIMDDKGRALRNFRKVAGDAYPERFYLAFIEEAKFADADVKDLNGDGDSKDVFGVLIFTVKEKDETPEDAAEGKAEGDEKKADKAKAGPKQKQKQKNAGGLRYVAVVDVNGDGDLSDGVRITDYWRKHQSFSLESRRGARKQLTLAANFYPNEKRLSLHYDSGGHGTHVAGIAAGYRINGQKGYHGMAPGARVISLKIGNNRYSGGSTVTESIKKALDYGVHYAKKHKVPVVYNMSFGIGHELENRSAVDRYVDRLLAANPGVVFVTSAGNEGPGLSSVGTPAGALRAISVGAMLGPRAASAQYGFPLDHEVAFVFSSRGGELFKPDIMAPGSASSTVPPWGNRDHFNGTSMASPAAAGAIARLVDGLVRHEKKFPVDNALVLRAVKNTARTIKSLGVLDQGGGALDLPAAYDYAVFLGETGEARQVREYRVINRGPAQGFGCVYWRYCPALPRPTDVMQFVIGAAFPRGMSPEAKARFYRAFDLEPDVDWISLTKPMLYLKGAQPTLLGIMVDLTGKQPGLYTGVVHAYRKSEERVGGKRVHEFAIPVSVLVPHRTTPENRGRFQVTGSVNPGDFERVFVEVPPGTSAISLRLRMLDGGKASHVSAALFDPDGVSRGNAGPVSEQGDRLEAHSTISGAEVTPGTWEIVVNSSIRSRTPARYDLAIKLSGVDFGRPTLFAAGPGPLRGRMLVPLWCTQAGSFQGTVKARLDRYVKREVVEMVDTDVFTRTIRLDDATRSVKWSIDFDRETWALFTDCVLQVVDMESGKTLRNAGLGQRSGSTSIPVSIKGGTSREYKVILRPAFALKEDTARWHFVLTEELHWGGSALELEPVQPKGGNVQLMPHDWTNLIFRLPAMMPTPPAGYKLGGTLEAAASGPDGVTFTEPLEL